MYGDGTIWYDSKRKKYCYDYCDNDGKRHRKRFATEKEAKEFKKEIRAERDKGNLTASTITIGEWVIEFLETYQKPHLRSSSFARQKQSANKLAPIAHIPIDQLSGKEIQKLYNSYDGILSTSSISKIHKLLFAAYKKAVALRMVQYNPMQAVEPVKIKYKEMSVFSFSELIRIFRVLRTNKYYKKYYTLFYLLLVLGCRIGELLAIKWEDIDFQNRILHIKRTVQRLDCTNTESRSKTILFEGPPKTVHSIREIPIPEFLYNIILSYNDSPCKGIYFLNPNTPMDPRTYQYKFQSILKKAGIESTHFHALRHTFATNCINSGADAKSVSEILGHANVNIT